MTLDSKIQNSIQYINHLDENGYSTLFHLTSLKEVKALILKGADPLLLSSLEHYQPDIKDYLQNYIDKLLEALLQSVPLYKMYQELHLKAKLLPIKYKVENNHLINTLNMGFEVIAKTVNHSSWCYYCLKADSKVMRCAICKTCWYCSAECQRNDWDNHARICCIYKKKLKK